MRSSTTKKRRSWRSEITKTTTDDLLLIPLRDALARSARRTAIEIITPPYEAAGIGMLRVVRATEQDGCISLTAAYEGYVRL